MKILVCADGSRRSQKALEKAAALAEKCKFDDVAIIHVYEGKFNIPQKKVPDGKVTDADLEYIRNQYAMQVDQGMRILQQALKYFEDKNITARTILKEGHPAQTIVSVAIEEGFDMIFIGSRGLGGIKKIFLGSVSNAVVQEIENCSVVIVK